MNINGKETQILETTLRDGSYELNFQFTANDTYVIAKELERVGFDLIEVGHGVGMGASEKGEGVAAETDEAYMKAAADAVSKSKYGMFCIPGIAELKHIEMAHDYSMGFIRIGTNATDVEDAEPFIKLAKKKGIFASSNLMKAYAMPAKEFAQKVKKVEEYGADMLCIADSAGSMFPEDLEEYVKEIREVSDIPLGFHGHNNFELAVANSLKAYELGMSVIDTSLQGMGRGAGNTPTEVFVTILETKGIRTGINPLEVMDVGEKYIRPLLQNNGYDSIDIVSGYAQFHSSYMGLIREFSSKYSIDPRRLIIAVGEADKVNASRDLVEKMAISVSQQSEEVFTARFRLDRYHGAEQNDRKQ